MTHIYEKGQMVIPKYYRDLLKWEVGTQVVMHVEKNCLVVMQKTSIADELEQFSKDANVDLKGKTDFDDENEAEEERMLKRKYKRMGIEF